MPQPHAVCRKDQRSNGYRQPATRQRSSYIISNALSVSPAPLRQENALAGACNVLTRYRGSQRFTLSTDMTRGGQQHLPIVAHLSLDGYQEPDAPPPEKPPPEKDEYESYDEEEELDA